MEPVEVKDITKSFRDVKALDGVSFSAGRGEIFGLIGPDGSGKSTLFRIMTTLLLPDNGSVTVEGLDVVRDYKIVRGMVGYMPGRFSLYKDLSVEENLEFYATVFKTTIKENSYLIEDIYKHLEPFKKRRANDLSGGMKQKLALCCALIHKPAVLFLDEPTTGVDPVSRKEFWGMLKKLSAEGISIIVSTPYMDEAKLCDRIALMQNGKFLKCNSPAEIVKDFNKRLVSVKGPKISSMLGALRMLPEVQSVYAFGDENHMTLEKEIDNLDNLAYKINNMGYNNIELKYISPGIEDSYMLFSGLKGE
jgi:ABC-type multidrug transport system ATPase subunit